MLHCNHMLHCMHAGGTLQSIPTYLKKKKKNYNTLDTNQLEYIIHDCTDELMTEK